MSIGEVVFLYATVFLVLLTLFIIVLRQRKAEGKRVFPDIEWTFIFQFFQQVLRGEFWLKMFIAATIASSAGVIIAIFVLPHGTAWAVGALIAVLLALVFSLPKLLA